jgi:hypothetical protein
MTSALRPNEPARQVIATSDNYGDAERAVDYMSDQPFEVSRLDIVGRELEYVEQILGRMNYGTASLRGVPGRVPWSARCSATDAISAPLTGCGPCITTSSRTWRLPIVRCNSSLAATDGY